MPRLTHDHPTGNEQAVEVLPNAEYNAHIHKLGTHTHWWKKEKFKIWPRERETGDERRGVSGRASDKRKQRKRRLARRRLQTKVKNAIQIGRQERESESEFGQKKKTMKRESENEQIPKLASSSLFAHTHSHLQLPVVGLNKDLKIISSDFQCDTHTLTLHPHQSNQLN